jgi:hypothetical protein
MAMLNNQRVNQLSIPIPNGKISKIMAILVGHDLVVVNVGSNLSINDFTNTQHLLTLI